MYWESRLSRLCLSFFGGNSSTNTNLASPAQICVLGDCSDQGSMKTKSLCNNYSDHFTLWPRPPPPVRTQFAVIGRRARSRCLFGGWRWRRGQRLFTLYKCINTEDTLFIEKIIKIASIMWDGHTRSLFFPVPCLYKRKFGTEASWWFMEINDETNPHNVECFYIWTLFI